MEVEIKSKFTEKIKKTPILQQTSFWSEVKRNQGIVSKAFAIRINAADFYTGDRGGGNNVADDLLVLFQDIGDNHKIGYVPYGPTIKPSEENQGVFLEELSESLRPLLPANCILLRYDLLWESPWARDDACYNDKGNWMGPPARVNQEIRLNFDTRKWNLKKANTNILPTDTLFIDLRKSEDRLLREMKSKTRYNIKLAYRKGVHVRKAGSDNLDVWYGLYRETCSRNRIALHDIKFFRAVMKAAEMGPDSQAKVELLIAEMGDNPLAALFMVCSGPRAMYLYGASSSRNRNSMATYALQWEAIRRARQNGCLKYDMFGIAPNPDPSHPLHGLYRFKTGFGGDIFHRMGCWDYPLHAGNYEIYLASEMHSEGYHLH